MSNRTADLSATRWGASAVVLAALLLSGCGASTDAPPAPAGPGVSDTGSATRVDPPDGATTSPPAPGERATTGKGGSTAHEDDTSDVGSDPADQTSGPEPGSNGGSSPGTDGDGSASGSSVLEMPVAPEPTTDSLADLLDRPGSAPLVTAPLPGAASARGRLTAGFPEALRPVRSTTVESSSVSPSGRRLQVALVGTTRLGPEQVLLALRTRLTRRGLVELEAPITAPGSSAIAFRRGRSVVTVTVTAAGARTSYLVNASLTAGGE